MLRSNTVGTRRGPAEKDRIALRTVSSDTCRAGILSDMGGMRAPICSSGCLSCSLPRLSVVNSAGVSSEHNSRTAAEMFPSPNLELIAATLAASGAKPWNVFSCEPLFLKQLMRTDDKFLLLPHLSERHRKFDHIKQITPSGIISGFFDGLV